MWRISWSVVPVLCSSDCDRIQCHEKNMRSSFDPGPGFRFEVQGLSQVWLLWAVIGQGFWASGRNLSGYPFSREFPRLAIYTKSRAEGPAFGVYRESWVLHFVSLSILERPSAIASSERLWVGGAATPRASPVRGAWGAAVRRKRI